MKEEFYPHHFIQAWSASRPKGYLEELAPAKLREDKEGIYYDADHPAWKAAMAKYRQYSSSKAHPSLPRPDPWANGRGAKMWSELHARPFQSEKVIDRESEKAWLDAFSRRLPCGECKRHWRQLLKEMPPETSSREAYFAWTVAAHNAVNRRLDKPEMSVEEAKKKRKMQESGNDQLILRNGRGSPVPLRDIYHGASAFLICCGPSLADMDLSPLKGAGMLTMGVNNSPKVFRPNLWVCVDRADHFLQSVWLDPKILKFAPEGAKRQKVFDSQRWTMTGTEARDCPNVLYYQRQSHRFDPETFLDEPKICWGLDDDKGGGRSVMLVALRLLYHLGVRQVYLLGADFHMLTEGGRAYAFDEKKDAGAVKSNNHTYATLQKRFERLRPIFEQHRLHIWNCTPWSKLTAFDPLPFKEAVERCALDTAHERTRGMYADKQDVPLIVGYYTENTGYEDEAKRLIESLDNLKLSYDIRRVPSLGSWLKNIQFKADFLRNMLDEYQTDLLYVDADAVVHKKPDLPHKLDCDLAFHRRNGKELLSGTIYLRPTPATRKVLDRWIEVNDSHPERLDQTNLDEAIHHVPGVKVANLPPSYCQIFDLMRHHGEPVIEHMQASRRLKRRVSTAEPR